MIPLPDVWLLFAGLYHALNHNNNIFSATAAACTVKLVNGWHSKAPIVLVVIY